MHDHIQTPTTQVLTLSQFVEQPEEGGKASCQLGAEDSRGGHAAVEGGATQAGRPDTIEDVQAWRR